MLRWALQRMETERHWRDIQGSIREVSLNETLIHCIRTPETTTGLRSFSRASNADACEHSHPSIELRDQQILLSCSSELHARQSISSFH